MADLDYEKEWRESVRGSLSDLRVGLSEQRAILSNIQLNSVTWQKFDSHELRMETGFNDLRSDMDENRQEIENAKTAVHVTRWLLGVAAGAVSLVVLVSDWFHRVVR